MKPSNNTERNDCPLDRALLLFGIHDALPAEMAQKLLERGDITLTKKFFRPLPEYLEYAELTPSGLSKWTDLEHRDTIFRSEGGTSERGDPASTDLTSRQLFTVERIQGYIADEAQSELLSKTHEPYRISYGLGGTT